ncbi:MAG: hypothetical protein ACUZ8E_16120 [Candidatus Anammoxibacter sp.]
MKKSSKKVKPKTERGAMLPEYDFKNMPDGVRGKYHKAYREGHTVKINKADGTTIVQHLKLEEGAVSIEPDVKEYFPDSETVNNALRCLIPLISKKRKVNVRKS